MIYAWKTKYIFLSKHAITHFSCQNYKNFFKSKNKHKKPHHIFKTSVKTRIPAHWKFYPHSDFKTSPFSRENRISGNTVEKLGERNLRLTVCG